MHGYRQKAHWREGAEGAEGAEVHDSGDEENTFSPAELTDETVPGPAVVLCKPRFKGSEKDARRERNACPRGRLGGQRPVRVEADNAIVSYIVRRNAGIS